MGQTGGRTDTVPFHRPRSAYYAGSVNRMFVSRKEGDARPSRADVRSVERCMRRRLRSVSGAHVVARDCGSRGNRKYMLEAAEAAALSLIQENLL